MNVELRRADIFFTCGSSWISGAIRLFTRTLGESRTMVNHVGLVIEDGPIKSAWVIEALSRVVSHPLWKSYGPPCKDCVAIYRPSHLSAEEVDRVVAEAKRHEGCKYGSMKIVAHFVDWLLLGAYVFRRFANMERYPICSWLVADAFKEVGQGFGVESVGAASPDDIWDFIQKHGDMFDSVRPLESLSG